MKEPSPLLTFSAAELTLEGLSPNFLLHAKNKVSHSYFPLVQQKSLLKDTEF